MNREDNVAGHLVVINVRLDALRAAIDSGIWDDVKFQYDRVLRAEQKLERSEAKRSSHRMFGDALPVTVRGKQ